MPPEPGARRAGRAPTIFAMGGGGFTMEPENPALDDYVRSLAPAREPRICLLPTAGGDSEDQIRRFHTAFGDQLCEPTHISLFRLGDAPGAAARAPARAGRDLRRRRLDDQPARAVARARARRDPARGVAGRDRARRAERRRRCAGSSAGVTKSVGAPGASRAGSASCRARTPSTTTASPSGGRSTSTRSRAATIPAGWGVDDGVGLLFRGTRLAEVVASRPGARAYRVHAVDGAAVEEAIEPRLLKARRTPTRRRRSRSRRCARCTPRGAATGATARRARTAGVEAVAAARTSIARDVARPRG